MAWTELKWNQDQERVFNEILDELASGQTLKVICAKPNRPIVATVLRRAIHDPEFGKKYKAAIEIRCHVWADESVDLADEPLVGEKTKLKSDGEVEVERGDNVSRSKLQIETRLKLIGKMHPEAYGDKSQMVLTGVDNGPIEHTIKVTYDDKDPESIRRAHEALFGTPEALRNKQGS